jgi:hypothetical protein
MDQNIVATVIANDTLIDVTSVVYDSVKNYYYCVTFKAVNPERWATTLNEAIPLLVPSQPGQTANILYENSPDPGNQNWYFNSGKYHQALSYGGGEPTFDVEYTQCNKTYTYLIDSELGLYKFHLPVSLLDTVDLSQMDTAVSSTLVVPAGDQITYFELDGIMDTTNLSTSLWLWRYINSGLSFSYPPKYVQKYETTINGTSSDGTESFFYYNYSDSVPSTMPFENTESYTLASTTDNEFSVKFDGIMPSYYSTAWYSGNISYYVWENPDSSSLKALPLLAALHSRMLAGMDISGLTLADFSYEMAPGYDYFGWLNYACNPSQLQTYKMGYEAEYTKEF